MQIKAKYFNNNKTGYKNSFIRINPKLVKTAINGNFIAPLALYYLLKGKYTNSRIYKNPGSKERLSELSGISIPTINKYFAILIKHNLLTQDKGAWILSPSRSKIKSTIIIDNDNNVSDIKNLLYLKYLENEGRKQAFENQFVEYTKGDTENKDQYKMELGGTYEPFFSIRYLSKSLNISELTARQLISYLNQEGKLKTERPAPEFMFQCAGKVIKYLDGNHGHRYIQNGALYSVQPSKHKFIDNPIQIKPMTLKRYKNACKNIRYRTLADKINLASIN